MHSDTHARRMRIGHCRDDSDRKNRYHRNNACEHSAKYITAHTDGQKKDDFATSYRKGVLHDTTNICRRRGSLYLPRH